MLPKNAAFICYLHKCPLSASQKSHLTLCENCLKILELLNRCWLERKDGAKYQCQINEFNSLVQTLIGYLKQIIKAFGLNLKFGEILLPTKDGLYQNLFI